MRIKTYLAHYLSISNTFPFIFLVVVFGLRKEQENCRLHIEITKSANIDKDFPLTTYLFVSKQHICT